MTAYFDESSVDEYRKNLISSRSKTSVLKIKILNIRSQGGGWPIFIFEGPDDKSLFGEWIRRLLPEIPYEPIVASGKDQALKFYDTLSIDESNLGECIYFFIDRDFDELKGRPISPKIFLTEHYAVENYVINEEVLEEILKDELHCHGELRVRTDIIEVFTKRYSEFLGIVKEINFNIYCARRYDVEIDNLPKKISKIANVDYDEVSPIVDPCKDITLSRPFTQSEIELASLDFENFDPRSRYRGKFSMMFFVKWLEMLTLMRNSRAGVMAGLSGEFKVRSNFNELGRLASKAVPPSGLKEFLQLIHLCCTESGLERVLN